MRRFGRATIERAESIIERRIHEALAELEREGVLSAEQRALVAARLALRKPRADRWERFVSVLGGMGAVLVGAGILYLVAYNWAELARGAKVALILGTWLGLHLVGWRWSRPSSAHPRLGAAVTTIAVLSFGAALALLAQVYQLSAEYPWSVFAWWLLNVPLVLASGSVLLLLVVTALFLVWSFWHAGVYIDQLAYRNDYWQVGSLALLGVGIGALLAGLGGACRASRFERFAAPLASIARAVAVGGLYTLSFRYAGWGLGWHGSSLEAVEGPWMKAKLLLPVACALLTAAVALALDVSREGRLAAHKETLVMIAIALVLAAVLWILPQSVFVLANAALLAALLLLVYSGARDGRARDVNFAIAVFALLLVSRYLEYLWDKLATSYAFIGLGLLLLVCGYGIEKRRKAWLSPRRGVSS